MVMEEVCRLCLQTNPKIKIFFGNVLEKINSVCNIKLDVNDKLPKHICNVCSNTLDSIIEFKNKCELNDQVLQNTINEPKFEIKLESDSDQEDLFRYEDLSVTKDEILSDNESESRSKTRKRKTRCTSIVADNSTFQFKNGNNVIIYEAPILYSPKRMLKKSSKRLKLKNGDLPISLKPKINKKSILDSHKGKRVNKRILENQDFLIDDNLLKTDLCPFCGELFKVKDLPAHILIHNPRPFKCDLCNKTFKYKCKLNPHLKTHKLSTVIEKKVECHLCGKYIKELYLKHHMPDNRDVKNYQCHICKQGFISKTCHLFHVKRHGPQPKKERKSKPPEFSQCHICGKTQSSKSRTKRHIIIAHLKNDYIQCKLCGKTMRKNHKPYHMNHAHVFEKKFECDVCNQKFISRERIREHLKTHLYLRPFQCNICGGKFTRNNTLKRHIKRHENRIHKGFENDPNVVVKLL